MILRFDYQIVMPHDDSITTHDCAYGRAPGQIDLIDTPPDNAGRLAITVRYQFQRFRRTAPQGMNCCDIALTHIGEQRTDGDMCRRQCDIDFADIALSPALVTIGSLLAYV